MPLRGVLGATLWGALMALSAAMSLILLDWQSDEQIRAIAARFGFGGTVGYLLVRIGFCLVEAPRRADMRFAAYLFALAISTAGVTATFFALLHRDYFAQWHAPFPSIDWGLQFVFTILGAFYQFAVLGLRLYLPLGLPALFVFALWQTARTR